MVKGKVSVGVVVKGGDNSKKYVKRSFSRSGYSDAFECKFYVWGNEEWIKDIVDPRVDKVFISDKIEDDYSFSTILDYVNTPYFIFLDDGIIPPVGFAKRLVDSYEWLKGKGYKLKSLGINFDNGIKGGYGYSLSKEYLKTNFGDFVVLNSEIENKCCLVPLEEVGKLNSNGMLLSVEGSICDKTGDRLSYQFVDYCSKIVIVDQDVIGVTTAPELVKNEKKNPVIFTRPRQVSRVVKKDVKRVKKQENKVVEPKKSLVNTVVVSNKKQNLVVKGPISIRKKS